MHISSLLATFLAFKSLRARWVASSILFLMALFMLGSAWNDSAIMDELPHIPAGYSYLAKQDYRLNPEHPPLIKMIAAVPLLFQRIDFPANSPNWTHEVNGQWEFGRDFLYRSGNDADSIIFWSRIPVMILALFTGWIFFRFVERRFSGRAALMALALFALSPTVIAHSRFVTTDLGATFGFLIGILAFIEFLEVPSYRNVVRAGIAFGIAQLLKFSLVLLLPIYVVIAAFWIFASRKHGIFHPLKDYAGKAIGILVVAALVIWPVYQFTVLRYPPERQRNDTNVILESQKKGTQSVREACGSLSTFAACPAQLVIWASDKPLLRPYAQYALGVLMVFQRQAGGNTAYFLGEVSNIGSRWYFPTAFLLKEPTPTLILLVIALYSAIARVHYYERYSWHAFSLWIRNHLPEFSALVMIAVYWGASIKSPLNIGLRHVMPTFPFIYLLASVQIDRWLSEKNFIKQETFMRWIVEGARSLFRQAFKYIVLAILLLWLFLGTTFSTPYYLSYYNALSGGTINGYRYIVDSNYDWGQDLKRLADYVEKNKIEKISLDYFGGGDPTYYLGSKFEPWWSARGPAHGWFAISSSFRQGAFGHYIDGLEQKPEDAYSWLKLHEPVDRVGSSIFIYKLP